MTTKREVLESLDDSPPRWRTVPFLLALLLAAVLGLILYMADRASEQRDRAIDRQRHSFEVMMLAEQLDGTLSQAEVLLARYVVSLDKTVGRQFQAEWRKAQAETAALDRATRDSPTQQDNVKEIKAAMAERSALLNDIALRTTYKQRLGALGRLYAAGRSPTVERVDGALQRTIDHERDVLRQRNALVDETEVWVSRLNDSYSLVGISLLGAALLALWFAYGASRERMFARRLAESEALRVDGLEAAVQDRTEELQATNAKLREEMQERARAEQSLLHLQKMEAIGKLTGGIAHDFNNMLAVIVSGIDLARQSLKPDPAKARRHLDNAMEGANRAAALTTRLLAFARPTATRADLVDVDELLRGMQDLITRATDDGIALTFALDGGGWTTRIEADQLENAVLNLVINAKDAMEGRGKLTISTHRATLSEGEIGNCQAADHIAIDVEDTGSGMTPDVAARAFEPFFTTKPIGKGTGLGLSQIFGFVRGSGGEIDLKSAPGKGTRIRLLLPRALAEEADALTDDSAPHAEDDAVLPARASLVVLVVEDDPRVLRATSAALKALGHRGIACNHPAKASALLAKHPDIALIISDVLMPDMTGPEMVASLAEVLDERPVIYVTGFAGESEDAALDSGIPILRKPFTIAQLARALDQALDTPPHVASIAGDAEIENRKVAGGLQSS